MIVLKILIPTISALLFASLLTYVFKRKAPGPFKGTLIVFIIIFMFTWVIGSWVIPAGPIHNGVPWLSYIVIGFTIMLLLGTIIPKERQRNRIIDKSELDKEVKKDKEIKQLAWTFGFFFWIMIFVLLALIIIRLGH